MGRNGRQNFGGSEGQDWRENRELAKDIGTRAVAQVLDGDTFVAEDNVIVRLVSVEAPEMEFCGGEKWMRQV